MKLDRMDHTPLSHRVGRYHFQMAQARLNTPVEPVSTYSLQPFYARQQEWMTELSHSLSRLYRFSAELDQAARQFSSVQSDRVASGSPPRAETAELPAEAETEELLHKTQNLVHRYNRLHAFLDEHQDILSTQKLDTFERITRAAEGPLRRFGLTLEANGQLVLNESAWRTAVQTDYAAFADMMKGLARQFREEVLRVQRTPLGSFTRSYDEVQSANPYASRSWSSLHYQYAAATGIYLDLRW